MHLSSPSTGDSESGELRVSKPISLVLADDHVVFLDGLTALLTQLGHRVLAAVSTLDALHDNVRALRPDICVLEVQLEDSGIETIARLASSSPPTRTVVLTADPAPGMLQAALGAGASGYVHKTRGIGVVLDVLRRVAIGEIVIEGSFVRPATESDPPLAQLQRLATYLTPREQECLTLLTAGQDTVAMAGSLGVSTTTVRSHVQAVLTKLGVHSRLEAAALAVRYQLVDTSGRLAPAIGR